ncbi:DUF3040 domain-containing protein [Lentzea sp. NPDC003310]|uniref:DUF3040 domain-containing protein n=1 Tax=Lentzea sp. NPDC003310 TaxID=3154447 RepID=UPI0033AAB0F7
MALAEHEKRELDEIEQRLAGEDPKLAAALTRPSPFVLLSRRTLRVLGLVAAHLCGLLVLVGGVTWSSVPLLVLGAVICAGVFAGLLLLARVKDRT